MKTLLWINRLLVGVILLFVIGALLFSFVTTRIELGEVGVVTKQFGVAQGVQQRDYGPGWHRALPMIDSWNTFDATVQTIEMSGQSQIPGRYTGRMVQLKSSDGYGIQLDLTIKFKIKEGEAYRLFERTGGGDNYVSLVQNEALDTFRDTFGGINTEEFYDPKVRREVTSTTQKVLRDKLENRHIELVDVLIRRIEFDPQYERKILDKKLADQDVELNKSKSIAEEKKGETRRIEAEAHAMVGIIQREKEGELLKMRAEAEKQVSQIRAEAEQYATESKADADLYAANLEARGTLLLRESEAEGERLKAEALKGAGGANFVALEAARNLDLRSMVVSTIDLDFLDLERMIQQLGAVPEP